MNSEKKPQEKVEKILRSEVASILAQDFTGDLGKFVIKMIFFISAILFSGNTNTSINIQRRLKQFFESRALKADESKIEKFVDSVKLIVLNYAEKLKLRQKRHFLDDLSDSEVVNDDYRGSTANPRVKFVDNTINSTLMVPPELIDTEQPAEQTPEQTAELELLREIERVLRENGRENITNEDYQEILQHLVNNN